MLKTSRWVGLCAVAALSAAGAVAEIESSELAQKYCPVNPPRIADPDAWIIDPIAMIMAGSASGSPPDSPSQRIDPNVSSSPYAGVCQVTFGGSAFCTGVPISRYHILSAAHCPDFNDNGMNNVGTNVVIRFNYSGSGSTIIGSSSVASVDIHPDYTGFNNPSVNDDLVIVTLNQPIPSFIPIYPLFTGQLVNGQVITMVGYGRSGHGDVGDTVGGNQNTKRVGQNRAEQFFVDDEGSGALELFQYDFDGPTGSTNCFGTGTMGNDIETSVASGDSGGPSLVMQNGRLRTWGINTFGGSCVAPAPLFGSTGGGQVVTGYLSWLTQFVPPSPFALLEPADDAVGVDVAPFFDWQRADFTSFYTLTIATDHNLTNVVFQEQLQGASQNDFTMPSGVLGGDTQYYWSVTATNANGETDAESGVFTFTTIANADLDGDGAINGVDLAILLSVWGTDGSSTGADLNGDGVVNGADLAILLGAWTG